MARELKVSSPTVLKVLRSNGVRVRLKMGRPAVPESEWKRRRAIAAQCVSWPEYAERIGKPMRNPAEHRLHGVRLGCWFRCGRLSTRATGIPGAGSGNRPVCPECFVSRIEEAR